MSAPRSRVAGTQPTPLRGFTRRLVVQPYQCVLYWRGRLLCRVQIKPAGGAWRRLDLPARTAEPAVSATIWLAGLAPGIAERASAVLRQRPGLPATG